MARPRIFQHASNNFTPREQYGGIVPRGHIFDILCNARHDRRNNWWRWLLRINRHIGRPAEWERGAPRRFTSVPCDIFLSHRRTVIDRLFRTGGKMKEKEKKR